MLQPMLVIDAGACVVFEGLDATGKSTQLDLLKAALVPDVATFAHMPSGFVPFTHRLYEALEAQDLGPSSGLAQQLAHLACHAESIGDLVESTRSKALVLDRWWWSTVAYGWYGGSVEKSGLSMHSFRELIDVVWSSVAPSVVFVFLEPHQVDSHNSQGVEAGYIALCDAYPDVAVVVTNGSEETTHSFIVSTLIERGLAHRV